MTPEQVADLGEHAHVYMTKDGRISMAGLNESNVQVSGVAGGGRVWCVAEQRHCRRAQGRRAMGRGGSTLTVQYFAENMSKAVKGELKSKSAL